MVRRKIEYRQYKRQDKKELTRILAEQIYNHFFEKEKDAQKYSRFVLKRAIGICKYGEVAVAGEKIVGAIFGIKKDKNHFLSDLERMVCYAQLKIRKKNREALKSLLLLDQMEQELMDKNNVDNEKLIFLFLLERRYEKAEIQEALLTEWESVGNGQKDKEMWIVVNGRAEPKFLDRYHFQKVDEKSAMIQPKEQRFRFYKTLYRRRESTD